MTSEEHAAMEGWYPVKILEDEDGLSLQWMRFGDADFSEPFFDESIGRARIDYEENRRRFRSVTSVEVLKTFRSEWNSKIALLIFHVSRCGSTLLAQLFTEVRNTTVLSEVPLLDQLLAYGAAGKLQDAETLFCSAVRIYGRDKQNIVVKTDSWHLFHFNTYRKYYHEVPAVLLFRNPHDVLLSHKRLPGMQSVIGLLSSWQLNNSAPDGSVTHSNYFPQLLEKYLSAVREICEHDIRSMCIAYERGAEAMFDKAIEVSMIAIDTEVKEKVRLRSGFHSKLPGVTFVADKFNHTNERDALNVAYELTLKMAEQ